MKAEASRLGATLVAAWLLSACGKGTPIAGDLVPNSPPNTFVTGTPPTLRTTGFEVGFHWSGADPDGSIVAFEYRISNNGPDGSVGVLDTLASKLPWIRTEDTDGTFLVSADEDSFPADVDDPRIGERHYRFWRTHTFFIRAIDDQGMVDPTPAHVSFTATTLAPTVRIDFPQAPIQPDCIQGPKVLTFGWTAEDPDAVTKEPEFVRYALLPISLPNNACMTQLQFELQRPLQTTPINWSDWIPYADPEGAGRRVTFNRAEAGRVFLFVVQAKDRAGAVTPTFEWGRNVRHIQTTNAKYPALTLGERFLGTGSVVSVGNLKTFDIAEGQTLQYTWTGEASTYGGYIEAYRYGWDVQDPDFNDDPGWEVPWGNGPNWTRASPRSFAQGTHNFVVQCRDNSGTISRSVHLLRVVQIPALSEQRGLLLVDDWRDDSASAMQLDALWDDMWERHLNPLTGFQPNDVFEASRDGARVTFANLVEYRSVIWFTNSSDNSLLHRQFAPLSRTVLRFNWLEIYQARVGNLMLVGPGSMVSSVESGSHVYPLIFNVPAVSPLGLGSCTDVNGQRYNCGVDRWPYSGFCMDLVDPVRPAVGFVFGEQDAGGVLVRSGNCDALHTAALDESEFTARFPDARVDFNVRSLKPLPLRLTNPVNGEYALLREEIYNRNTTARAVTLVNRPCQVPMFRWKARRDMGAGPANPAQNCFPRNRQRSSFDNAPCAIASQVYSDSKPIRGASDFVWGFHPMAFDQSDVGASLRWILESNWQLPYNR